MFKTVLLSGELCGVF